MGPPPCVLTIAGSDSGGGAGVQADLKTFAAYGAHGLSAIAALTAQNTCGVSAVHSPPGRFLDAQIDALFLDFPISVVKIGMLADRATVLTVVQALRRHSPAHIVLDPVMIATSGASLLDDDAALALREHLLPMSTLLTPNIPEAEALLGYRLSGSDSIDRASGQLRALGANTVLLKGGHLQNETVSDRFDDGVLMTSFIHPRLSRNGHGTGCTLASAVAAGLAHGCELPFACELGCDYVHAALQASYRLGNGGLDLLDHFAATAVAVATRSHQTVSIPSKSR